MRCVASAEPSPPAFRTWNTWVSAGRWPLAILVTGLLCGLVSSSLSWHRLPVPSLHDEFSNLLLADTLLHGRLANPSPEIWQPFQSFHVLVNPSYASKYPLGPGALLALGWMICGTPAAGIWISAAFCAMCVTWAAAGCMPRRWAFIAGILLAISPSVHHQWSLCYINGWLTAAVGGLVAGATLRLRKPSDACINYRTYFALGSGIAGLALTRPFEGLLFTLCCAGLLLYWWRHSLVEKLRYHTPRLLPCAAVPVLVALGLMILHNLATTGRATCMPYQLHEMQYGVAPLNIFQSPKQPAMTEWSADVPPTVLAFHYGWSLESYLKRNHLAGWCGAVAERVHVVTQLWGMLLCLPIALMAVVNRGPHRQFAVVIGLVLLIGSFVPWYFSHYFAPSLVWLVILSILSFVWFVKRLAADRRALRFWLGCLLLVQLTFMVGEVLGANRRDLTWADQRQALLQRLTDQGGQHLVLVRYHSAHNVHDEWVYNGADLERSPVIWARSWRPDLDQRLMDHYSGRQVWILQLDEEDRPHLTPLLALEGH